MDACDPNHDAPAGDTLSGLLSTMPAYYMLKWGSPVSLRAGGFGNDMGTPLAMHKDGFGAVAAALVEDFDLEVKLGARVTSITRSDSVATVLYRQPGNCSTPRIACNLLVLRGPIPKYVRGSADGTALPILTPAHLERKGRLRCSSWSPSLSLALCRRRRHRRSSNTRRSNTGPRTTQGVIAV